MSQLSWQIRSKPQWWRDYKLDATRYNLRDEALKQIFIVNTPSATFEITLSPAQIDYVLDELDGYDHLRDGPCQVSCFERIWESSEPLHPEVASSLNVSLDALLSKSHNLSEQAQDVTTEIIDHRLYPLVYNRTLVPHHRINREVVYLPIAPPTARDAPYATSQRFAALPADVFIRSQENKITVKFMSYINNLDPTTHQETYMQLETLLGEMIPLFEHVLTDLHRNNPLVPRIRGPCRYTVWDEPEPPDHSDDEEGWVNYESEMRQWTLNRPITLPDIPLQGYRGGLEMRRHTVSLLNSTVQVLVNVSKTTLVPGGPAFSGSPWHVEGFRAERVVACGYHIISMKNITDTSLRFRMAVTFPRGFSAGDTGATLRTWGIRDGDSSHQYIGDAPIRAGLSIVFPNIYQHCQTPFRLADPSKDGHITVVKFFLVDPDIKPVLSTSLVAPQQKEWIYKAIFDNVNIPLPYEVVELVAENVQGLMTKEEAEAYRRQLLEEVDRFTQANNSYHFCIPFDIWNGSES